NYIINGKFKDELKHLNQVSCERKFWKNIKDDNSSVPDGPRRKAVAIFQMTIGHDCLAAHLQNFYPPIFLLCHESGCIMNKEHLTKCAKLIVTTVWRVLNGSKYHPYHINMHQQLEDFQSRAVFCNWLSGKNRQFHHSILWTDEVTFKKNGDVNIHNARYWSQVNPLWLREVDNQRKLGGQQLTFKKCLQIEELSGVCADENAANSLIMIPVGSRAGFLQVSALLYKAGTTTRNYHSQMNGLNFEKWVREKLLTNLPPQSVVALDNAPYHNVEENKAPSKYAVKTEMVSWLQHQGAVCDMTMRKEQLYEMVLLKKSKEKNFKIDQILKAYGHSVIRLPPYMCDLNVIELVWSEKIPTMTADDDESFSNSEGDFSDLEPCPAFISISLAQWTHAHSQDKNNPSVVAISQSTTAFLSGKFFAVEYSRWSVNDTESLDLISLKVL
ncbi:hypothetical protein ANN_24694, partial [Periplaneta americana]